MMHYRRPAAIAKLGCDACVVEFDFAFENPTECGL
jgi:hypothetical protein